MMPSKQNGTPTDYTPAQIRQAMTARYPWLPDEKGTDGTLFDKMPAELVASELPACFPYGDTEYREDYPITLETLPNAGGFNILAGGLPLTYTSSKPTADVLLAALVGLDARLERRYPGEQLGRVLLAHISYPETPFSRLALETTLNELVSEG